MWPDRLSWSVALRGLRGSGRLTALTTVVVCVSVILVIFLSSLIEGLRVNLVAETTGAISHIEVRPRPREVLRASSLWTPETAYVGRRGPDVQREPRLEGWPGLVSTLEGFSPQILTVSPSASGQGFAARGAQQVAVRILGVEPARYDRVARIEERLRRGRFLRLGPGEVAIGYQLAEDLGVEVGDRVRLMSPRGEAASKRVAGIYETGLGALDRGTALVLLGEGQSLFGLGASVTSVGVTVEDVFEAPALAQRLQKRLPHEVRAWTQDNQRLLDALQGQKRSSDMITVFTAIAAAFAVASILIVLVTNKIQEIGVLKAMGATQRQIRHIFAIQGVVLASGGALLGELLGVGFVEALSRVEVQNAAGRVVPLFPFALRAELLLATSLLAALLGLLASVIPARRAARVNPIEVIRG